MVAILSGCGLGEKTEEKLFEAMKENGLLELDCDYKDYDEVYTVSQSPVPKNITYYEYRDGKVVYTIDYDSRILGEDDSVYQVRVETKTKKETTIDIYYFEKDSFEFRKKK